MDMDTIKDLEDLVGMGSQEEEKKAQDTAASEQKTNTNTESQADVITENSSSAVFRTAQQSLNDVEIDRKLLADAQRDTKVNQDLFYQVNKDENDGEMEKEDDIIPPSAEEKKEKKKRRKKKNRQQDEISDF